MLLRELREERGLSQFALALQTEVSQRHLSFVETGRANPSPELIGKLADRLELALRERNRLLLAAGHAPVYRETSLDDVELDAVREAARRILKAHEPAPALLVDRRWNVVELNQGVALLAVLVAPHLLEPPVNVMRVSLHPDGLAPHVVNFGQWREHLLARLRRQIAVSLDDELAGLYEEVSSYPGVKGTPAPTGNEAADVLLPMRLRVGDRELEFFSTMTVFGTAADITVAELAIESFFPADAETRKVLEDLA
ncbi:helix-turn-helix domain-containing protein [Actinocorallia aurantiaca]|uniref:Helix-turn-helix transcriptional regulator n=1 Tax=Actinocorallia aurantiaca TaxID=46204 RepID=A0ABP6GBQ3_9ACTN